MTPKVPNNIAKLRKVHSLSQETLAGRLNMSVTQLSRLERGTSSLTQSRIAALARVFDVEPHEIFSRARSKEQIDLDLMREVIVQLDEMVLKLGLSLTPQQRGDLTIELYKLESEGVDQSDSPLDLRKYEGMLRSFR